MKVSIIVPFYNNWMLTNNFLLNLSRMRLPDYELVLVNDGSDKEANLVKTGVQGWMKHELWQKVSYMSLPYNMGFSEANNRGAEIATGQVYIFTQNDVTFHRDFVTPVLTFLSEKPDSLIGHQHIGYDTGWNSFTDGSQKIVVDYLVGYFLACTREVWERLGGFDERYSPLDYEDVDLSTTAKSMGINLVGMPFDFLNHKFGQTTSKFYGADGRAEITRAHKQAYYEKWGWEKLVKLYAR